MRVLRYSWRVEFQKTCQRDTVSEQGQAHWLSGEVVGRVLCALKGFGTEQIEREPERQDSECSQCARWRLAGWAATGIESVHRLACGVGTEHQCTRLGSTLLALLALASGWCASVACREAEQKPVRSLSLPACDYCYYSTNTSLPPSPSLPTSTLSSLLPVHSPLVTTLHIFLCS